PHRPTLLLFLSYTPPHRVPPSFPTRRSSDLIRTRNHRNRPDSGPRVRAPPARAHRRARRAAVDRRFRHRLFIAGVTAADADLHTDRKSTRLNSSHVKISYAVFCLKKKKN